MSHNSLIRFGVKRKGKRRMRMQNLNSSFLIFGKTPNLSPFLFRKIDSCYQTTSGQTRIPKLITTGLTASPGPRRRDYLVEII